MRVYIPDILKLAAVGGVTSDGKESLSSRVDRNSLNSSTSSEVSSSAKERANYFVALSFRPNRSIKMGGTDRCGILFYASSTTAGIGLLLVAPAP
jgi:hypothetical protein